MTEKLTNAAIAILAAATPRATWEHFIGADANDEIKAAFNEYGNYFAAPADRRNTPCLVCGEFGAGFTWGMMHGAGHCMKCHWPARLYHFVKMPDGTENRVVTLLQAHPSNVSVPE